MPRLKAIDGGSRPIGAVECHDDIANALIRRHGDRLRFVSGFGWHVWDGKRWQRDAAEKAHEFVKSIGRALRRRAAEQDNDALWKLARSLNTAKGIGAILDFARSDPLLRISPDRLDSDPWRLNVQNGTIDLRTGERRSHDPGDLITRCCPVDFDPSARAPMFEKFMREIQPNQELRDYLARLFGYAAIGVVQEHVLACLWGPGANGKSVLVDVVSHVLDGYAKPGPSTLIVTDGKHTPHPTDVASCHGSRLVVVHETKRGAAFDASKVKLLTGGDKLTARHMRQDFFEFDPTHTLVMLSNYKPEADANDAALWRRVQLVPFEVVIPPDKQDRTLAERIKREEAAGVLRWIVEGAQRWREQGLNPPKIVREQTAAYRAAEDVIGRFIEECCVTGPGIKVGGGALLSAFKTWCQDQGERSARGNEFSAELQGRGFERRKTSSGAVYHGIGLHASEFDEVGRS